MAELLLELFSEEIPSRMQEKGARDLARLVTDGLKAAGLGFEAVRHYSGPRRLTLVVEGLSLKSSDVRQERKGPRVDAPEQALQGFLRSTGLTLDECEVRDDKKGQFYIAVIDQPGRPAPEIISEIVREAVRNFPWPKSMRWGATRLRWVRPLHSILCLFNGKPVNFLVDDVAAGNKTFGHRFHAPKAFKVDDFEDYTEKLKEAFVVLEEEERAEMILSRAKQLAKTEKMTLVQDEGLLREVAGLVEWPVALMGRFDKDFLKVPSEVLIAAMKKHQKCFSLKKRGKLANRFILVSNLEAEDGGEAIIAGNERVIRARLSDAKFFWDNDLARPLEELLPKLETIVFHAKLGTVGERARRLETLSAWISERLNADADAARAAARLSKADLVSETVYEEPEMQGIAGRYLALAQGKSEVIANAIEAHYKPQGPNDDVPGEPVSIALALADKFDLLTGFWAIGEKPTGSKDPFALRRAALGIIRLVLENSLRLSLNEINANACERNLLDIYNRQQEVESQKIAELPESLSAKNELQAEHFGQDVNLQLRGNPPIQEKVETAITDLLSFFADRLKVYLRDQGARHDLIDAVFALGGQDDLLLIVKRVEALGAFLGTEDGASLLAGLKRAQNILKIEEGKDETRYDGKVDESLLALAAEKQLFKAISTSKKALARHIRDEDFTGAMTVLAQLRGPVDAFFDDVIVNDKDSSVRANRLHLLGAMRAMALEVADFSRIEG